MRRLRAGLVTRSREAPGSPPGRHYDRSARSSLDWDRLRRLTAAKATSQEARTWGLCLRRKSGDASRVERREAPALRKRSAARLKTGAPLGAPLPRWCGGEKCPAKAGKEFGAPA